MAAAAGKRARRDDADLRPDLSTLPRAALEAMAAAGDEVVECVRVLAKTGDNIVGELLKTEATFFEWDHYPKGDVFDPETHAQYYYHAHPGGERVGEHGHFHTFLRPAGMPRGVRPAPLPDYAPPADPEDALCHLVAVSMDKYGLPIKLFTTNRWVTGETWYAAPDVVAMLDRFVVDLAQPSWPVNRWLTAMIRLFRPQIERLLARRDETITRWQAGHPGTNAYEDRGLEVVSEVAISVDDQIRAVRAALKRAER
ncbi:MAG TPA: hypothetical protein VF274_01145 [Alphaproteobacteria bacterium]|jgi:hypothetical protein